eukprot:gb/GEZN01006042.1/.p1 GENE.gb/GEZN01006042.1/~~gb/GEZN01006042.1/.p1  ORF type:complete len:379 (-),score=76.07 gb/GEZN01006042.1/:519-1655(-)
MSKRPVEELPDSDGRKGLAKRVKLKKSETEEDAPVVPEEKQEELAKEEEEVVSEENEVKKSNMKATRVEVAGEASKQHYLEVVAADGLRETLGDGKHTFKHYIYKGTIFQPIITPKMMEDLTTFKTRETDVFVATYPKSGTTWVQQIICQMSGWKGNVSDLGGVSWLEANAHQLDKVEALPSPRYFQTHTPWKLVVKGKGVKYVVVVRDGRDVAVSFFHHCRAFKLYGYDGSWEHFFKLFIEGQVDCGLWMSWVVEWWRMCQADPEHYLLVRYEDMKKNLTTEIQRIAKFVHGKALSTTRVKEIVHNSTFTSMKKSPACNKSNLKEIRNAKEGDFLRKGVVGDWRNVFSSEQIDKYRAVYDQKVPGTFRAVFQDYEQW